MDNLDNKHSDEVDPLDLLTGESRKRWQKMFGNEKEVKNNE